MLFTEAAIDANAPLQEDIDTNGPVDSDEERDSVMAAIARSNPKPLSTHTLITSKTKYRYVRIKEQMLHAIGGRGGGGIFSTDDTQSLFGGNIFQPLDPEIDASSSPMITSADPADGAISMDGSGKTPVQNVRKSSIATAS